MLSITKYVFWGCGVFFHQAGFWGFVCKSNFTPPWWYSSISCNNLHMVIIQHFFCHFCVALCWSAKKEPRISKERCTDPKPPNVILGMKIFLNSLYSVLSTAIGFGGCISHPYHRVLMVLHREEQPGGTISKDNHGEFLLFFVGKKIEMSLLQLLT